MEVGWIERHKLAVLQKEVLLVVILRWFVEVSGMQGWWSALQYLALRSSLVTRVIMEVLFNVSSDGREYRPARCVYGDGRTLGSWVEVITLKNLLGNSP